jgi:hypothetical protein
MEGRCVQQRHQMPQTVVGTEMEGTEDMKKAKDMTREELRAIIEMLRVRMRIRGIGWVRRKDRPRCTAQTRSGKPCQAPAVWDPVKQAPRNGCCRMHGVR